MLDDKHPLVVLYAARALINNRNNDLEKHLEKIVNVLDRYEDWSYRLVNKILSNAGPDYSYYYRERFMDEQLSSKTRVILGKTLLLLKDKDSAEVAAQLLQNKPERDLAITCLEIISQFGSSKHISLVREWAESKDPGIKAQALEAIGTVGNDKDLNLLEKSFIEYPNWVTMHSAKALKKLQAFDILQELTQLDNNKSNIALQTLKN